MPRLALPLAASLAIPAILLAASLAWARPEPRPVLIENSFVNPNSGVILGRVPGASPYQYAVPMPGQEGRFRLGDLVVDVDSQSVVGRELPEIVFVDDHVVRRDSEGSVRWKVRMPGRLGNGRPPDRLLHDGRVFVALDRGIAAFDAESATELWRVEGENERLFATGGLLLATSAGSVSPEQGRWLVARSVETGRQLWRGRIADACDPESISEVAGLILVRADRSVPFARFFDPRGALVIDLSERVLQACAVGEDLMVVTDKRTARLDRSGRARWENPDLHSGDFDGAEVIPLEEGDAIVLSWCPISDSGVEVSRFSTGTGKTVWKARCEPVGVSHSKYWHYAYAEVRLDRLVVVSQGAYGNFVETLDLLTGESVFRAVLGMGNE